MSTPGGRDNHRRRWSASLTALFGAALLLALTLLASGVANATSPEQAPGEIVFANGGRIVSIKADGTGRKVLTRKHGAVVAEQAWDAMVPVEDSSPSISPDGTKLLFQRDFDTGPVSWNTQIIVANRDGTGQKVIAKWKSPYITWLGWDESGRVVVDRGVYKMGRKYDTQKDWVVSFDQSGGDRKLLISREIKSSDFKSYDRFLSSSLTISDFSPDGKSILYSVSDMFQSELRELNLETREEHVVLKGVDAAAYSPDGTRITFNPASCWRDNEPDACPGWKYGLWTANLDGTGRKRLLGNIGGVSGPEFSPDGSTILFVSARNFPGGGVDADEIYSIGIDGSCLAWLTNGSPESVQATWAPEALGSNPDSCGNNGLKPLVEVRPKIVKKATTPRLWAGPQIQGRLLSAATNYRGSDGFEYADCGYYLRSKCREGIEIDAIPVCNPGNLASGVDIYPRTMVPSISRGAMLNLTSSKKGKVAALLLTGQTQLYFGDSAFLHTGGIATTRNDLKLVTNLLRPVGKPLDQMTDLPAPVLEAAAARNLERTYRIFDRTGSIARTAKLTESSRMEIRWLVRHRSLMEQLQPFKEVKCVR